MSSVASSSESKVASPPPSIAKSSGLSDAAQKVTDTLTMAAAGIRESLPQSDATLMNTDPAALQARENRLRQHRCSDPRQPGVSKDKLSVSPQCEVKLDVQHPMLALEWHGNKTVKLAMRASPLVTDPNDVIVRITSTSICGSDLHSQSTQTKCNELAGGLATFSLSDLVPLEYCLFSLQCT